VEGQAEPPSPPVAPAEPPPVRGDLDDEDLEFKIHLTIVGRKGELASRSVTISCSGGLGRTKDGAVLQAREAATSQMQTLLRRMLDKLQADASKLTDTPPLALAPGPSAIAALAVEPPSAEGELEELAPRT